LAESLIRIHIERLPEDVDLATTADLVGLVDQERTIAETMEIPQDVARKLIESYMDHADPYRPHCEQRIAGWICTCRYRVDRTSWGDCRDSPIGRRSNACERWGSNLIVPQTDHMRSGGIGSHEPELRFPAIGAIRRKVRAVRSMGSVNKQGLW